MSENFDLNWNEYVLVDLTRSVFASESDTADVRITRERLQNGTFSHAIVSGPARTGTYVELPRHFYEDGKTLKEFPLSAFMGSAVLASGKRPEDGLIDAEWLDESAGDYVRRDDILTVRMEENASGSSGDKAECFFSLDAAHWILGKGVKMLVADSIGMGRTVPEDREFQDILLGRDIPMIHTATNLAKLRRPRFYMLAWPVRFYGIGSLWVRLGAIVSR